MSRLYIVSTPIGNLGDMTHRGIEILRQAARVLAEDTRRTGILLRHYEVATPLVSLHEHNEAARSGEVLGWLDAGEDLALVSDAGTPLLSDPGARLVAQVVDRGHEVVPVPGASAILAALVASGIEPEPFTFLGFVERGGAARRARLARLAVLEHAAVLFESPNRLPRLLSDLLETCGPDRRAAVARELTKVHETVVRGTLAELVAYYQGRDVRGEVVVVLAGRAARPAQEAREQESVAAVLAAALLERGERPSAVARELTRRLGMPRNAAYEMVQRLAEESE